MKTLYKIIFKRSITLFFIISLISMFTVPDALGIPQIPEIPPFPTIISNGNTYHVDGDHPNAANDLSHGTYEEPWQSLQYSIWKLVAGDTLIVHETLTGYDQEWLSISGAGDVNDWITIMGAEGENVVIQCCRVTFESAAKYILFENIDIKGTPWDLVKLRDNSHHIVLDDLEIDCLSSTENYTGVWVYQGVNNVWFRDMDIHHCGYKKTNPTDCSGVCISSPRIRDITFMNVIVRDNKGDGIGSGSGTESVYFDGCTADNNTGDGFDISATIRVILKNSVSSNNGPDQGVGFKSWAKETWLVNYIAVDNTWEAICHRPHWDDSKIYVLNSTFVGNNKTHYGGQIRIGQGYPNLGNSYVYLYNTIFHSVNTKAVVFEEISRQILAGEDNNYYFSANDPYLPNAGETVAFQFRDTIPVIIASYTFSEMGDGTWFEMEGVGENDIGKTRDYDGMFDCGFYDLDNRDFYLCSDSLAIDAGIDLGIAYDFDGRVRPMGSGPDIGAYEACTDNDNDGYAIEGQMCGPVDIDDNDDMLYRIEDLTSTAKKKMNNLKWSCAPEAGDYNIYRSTVQGGPYDLIKTKIMVDRCSHNDTKVTSGMQYFYVVKWIDSLGHETSFSNEISATAR